ncbi:hypothetical protein XPA_002359 [Xanthoria parietina]
MPTLLPNPTKEPYHHLHSYHPHQLSHESHTLKTYTPQSKRIPHPFFPIPPHKKTLPSTSLAIRNPVHLSPPTSIDPPNPIDQSSKPPTSTTKEPSTSIPPQLRKQRI